MSTISYAGSGTGTCAGTQKFNDFSHFPTNNHKNYDPFTSFDVELILPTSILDLMRAIHNPSSPPAPSTMMETCMLDSLYLLMYVDIEPTLAAPPPPLLAPAPAPTDTRVLVS
jgi:hypothetical protein